MIVVLGALFLVAGTVGAIFDDRKWVKIPAWTLVYVGIFMILIGIGGIAAIRDALEF